MKSAPWDAPKNEFLYPILHTHPWYVTSYYDRRRQAGYGLRHTQEPVRIERSLGENSVSELKIFSSILVIKKTVLKRQSNQRSAEKIPLLD